MLSAGRPQSVNRDPFDKMGTFLLALLFAVMRIGSLVSGSRVELVDNGYVNLVVAITPATPRTQSTAVIENIKV